MGSQAAYSRSFFPVDSPAFYLLGGLGPGLAAWIMMRLLYGSAGDRLVFGSLLRWRFGPGWYAVVVLVPVVLQVSRNAST